jgi:arabinan endo-1,5-alpha-L-arabinosidase
MLEAQQKWVIAPVANAGGCPGSPYFKITIAGTERALAATEEDDLIAVPVFTGAPEQLWRLDALADGAYRIMPKAERAVRRGLALTSIGQSTVTLAPFKAGNDKQQWLLEQP